MIPFTLSCIYVPLIYYVNRCFTVPMGSWVFVDSSPAPIESGFGGNQLSADSLDGH